MEVAVQRDWIYLKCEEEEAKKLDAIWIKSRNCYRLPNTLGAMREIANMGYKETAFMEYGKKKSLHRQNMIMAKEAGTISVDKRLRPYQEQDINFLRLLPSAGIFNEQRTGKTPTTLKLLEYEGWKKAIIVCPASLVLNWAAEALKWTDFDVFPIKGTKPQRNEMYRLFTEWEKPSVMIMSVGTLSRDLYEFKDELPDFCLVVDEAHFLRNWKTNQTKRIKVLAELAKKRYALTGTPAMNHASDIYGILSFLFPSRYRSYQQFTDRYFNVIGYEINSFLPYKRKDELTEILELISVQRKRSEVMQWIPPKQYQTIPLEMDKKQQKVYDDMLNDFVVEQDGEVLADAPGLLAQLTRLRQISLAPSLLGIDAKSVKTDFILDWLDNNPNEPVVIFTNFTSYFTGLRKELNKRNLVWGEIHGNIGLLERKGAVDDFQAGKLNILLCNIQAAGVGLTLDRASTVIFMDRNYVPALNAQAEDRIVPTTEESNQNVLVIDLVCSSIDEKINAMLAQKIDITETVNSYKNLKGWLES